VRERQPSTAVAGFEPAAAASDELQEPVAAHRRTRATAATMQADELSDLTATSTWTLYKAIREGTCPFPYVRCGKKILFIRSRVNEILGLGGSAA
jgi:predicted DNA-binding transcriptional regulator AlpA